MTKKVIMIPPQPVTGEVTASISAVQPSTAVQISRNTILAPNAEQSLALAANLKRLEITSQLPNQAEIKVSFTAGQSGTNYAQIPINTQREFKDLDFSGQTLYYQSPVAGTVVEVLQYT